MNTSYPTGKSFASNFSTSSKTNPCPVCGRTKDTDCRISRDGKMVLCHQNFDHTKTHQPDLWHFDKPSSDGRCGIYVFKEKTESIQPTARKSRAKKKENQPTPIPSDAKLLRLPAPGKPPRAERPKYIPPGVPHNAARTTYSYSSSQKVFRYEWPDATNPKGHAKTYRQIHIDPNGKEIWNKGDAPWSAYRMDEVIELLKTVPDSEPIIIPMPEGEHNVEIARSIGIAGLTLQGSEWSDRETLKMLEALRATGKNVSIGVLRDNDDTGTQKSKGVWLVARHIKFPCIVIDSRVIYPEIPEKGDIKEILDALGPDEFLKRLSAEIDSQSQNPPADLLQSSSEQESDDNLPTKPKTKLSMREAAEEAREILRSERDELTTNILLEEVRLKTGMGDYAWENKIIKPLKRDMNGERFKLELLSLLQMSDPVERYRQIALLAPKYSMGARTIEKAMSAMKQQTQTLETKRLTFEDLLDSESEAVDWLVPGLLPVGETVLLCALPKVGKSKLAIDLAFSVATGESRFLGQETKQGKVLLITPDASKMSLKQELIKRGFRKQDSPNLHIFPEWSIDQMAVLEEELENFRPDLVVIDSLKKITVGQEISENSDEFANNIIALNDMLKRYRATGILIHHANKSNDAIGVERARGSTAIVGSCWGTWMLERIPKKDPNNAKRMIVDPKDPKRIFTATSRDAEGTTLNIEFNVENNSWEFMGEVGLDEQEAKQQSTYQERILLVLRENQRNLSGPEIMELMGIGREQRNSVYTVLGRMENKRLINSRPAPGDKRFNLYSLYAPKSNDEIVISQPPPPPQETVSNVDYYSETHAFKGFEDSQHNSQQIVNTKKDCATPEIAETLDSKGVNEIVNTQPLLQGGEGVKCASAEVTEQAGKAITNVDREPVVSVTPSTPAKVGAKHKEFKKGDRVVIAEVGTIHQGQHGEVVSVRYGSRETDYIVKLDKESRGSKQVRITVPKGSKLTFLMKL